MRKILFIEDSVDTLDILKKLFADDYIIFGAISACEARSILNIYNIDLIVSDINLPDINGIDFILEIRKILRLCNIPVVFLSGMDPLDFELKALQAGAYDYICKPFRTRELKLKIDNQLKTFPFNYINDSNNINVSKSNLTNKIDTILEERFGDSSLSILFLCDSLNISQSTLNRKFFAETGFTVVNYIRFFRLNKAQKLLEVGELNKSLVAFACGFNSLSYFCKEYKLLFNSNPIRLNNKTTSLQA